MFSPTDRARNFSQCLLCRDFSFSNTSLKCSHPSFDALSRRLSDEDEFLKMPISDKVHAALDRKQLTLAQLHIKHIMNESNQLMLAFVQILLIIREQNEVVAIPEIRLAFQLLLDEVVELRHIDIAEDLA